MLKHQLYHHNHLAIELLHARLHLTSSANFYHRKDHKLRTRSSLKSDLIYFIGTRPLRLAITSLMYRPFSCGQKVIDTVRFNQINYYQP